MLVLSRKCEESVVIGSPDGPEWLIKITVVGIRGGRVKLGFEAPVGIRIDRAELLEQQQPHGPSRRGQSREETATKQQIERWDDDGGETKCEVPSSSSRTSR